MGYTCQNFEDGQLLTAECLNRMERGIEDAHKAIDAGMPLLLPFEIEDGWPIYVGSYPYDPISALYAVYDKNVPIMARVYKEEGISTDYVLNRCEPIGYQPDGETYDMSWIFTRSDGACNEVLYLDDHGVFELCELPPDGPGNHNSIYRGKCLGTFVSTAQYKSIAAGTFDDMYIGDYWDIKGVRYRIAAFDYYSGDTVNEQLKQEQLHHVTIVPDFLSTLSYPMVAAGGVAGGYLYSDMSVTHLKDALQIVLSAFGKGHLMCYHPKLISSTNSSNQHSQVYCWRFIDLMNEQQVFGSRINGMITFGELNRVSTESTSQFPLFAMRPDMIVARNSLSPTGSHSQGQRFSYWLRDICSPRGFCVATGNGNADVGRSDLLNGVRPFFSIVASNAATVAARKSNATYEDYGLDV